MSRGFQQSDVDALFVRCHRRYCLCHRFCGVKIETDHIVPIADGGNNDIDNAIALCFECHTEVHSYNIDHPRGRKVRPNELRMHREQWLKICDERPEVILAAVRDGDVGPLQSLQDELEFNIAVAATSITVNRGALFQDSQFLRTIHEGMVSILNEELKKRIISAYVAVSRANQSVLAEANRDTKMKYQGTARANADDAIRHATRLIGEAYNALTAFLQKD